MTYQPPQNILAAILQSRKQNAYNDPGIQMPQTQGQTMPMQQIHAPIGIGQIMNGFMGNNQTQGQQQPSALSMLTNQIVGQVPGSQQPTNAFAQLTGIGNSNQSNGQNLGAYLAKLFGGQ